MKTVLDAYVCAPGDPEEFCASMLARCRSNPDTIWDLLALIDQYERRGQVLPQDFRDLKTALGREACGRPMPGTIIARQQVPRVTEVRRAGAREPTETTAYSQIQIPRRGLVLRNRFVLEDVIGSGGMGKVYRAFDRNRLDLPENDRYVALKVLRDDLAMRPEALDRLKREFHQTQRLSHPGIVNVFDLDSEAGIHFITMELLHGELLGDVMARVLPERLDRRSAFTVLRDLGNALSYAHECGIVHADLKPGNVMITLQGELRVLDFGLSMPLMREPWIATSVDAFQGVTRTYASCERLAGDSPEVRDDVFSYACMAYELLAGRHPFSRKPATEARDGSVSLRRIPDLSRRQWRALSRGLAWERADRQDSLAELVADLVPASFPRHLPPPHQLQARPLARSNAAKWYLAGAALLAVVMLLIAGLIASESPSFASLKTAVFRSGDLAAAVAGSAITGLDQWRERSSTGIAGVATPDTSDARTPVEAGPPGVDSAPDSAVADTDAPTGPRAASDTPPVAAASESGVRAPGRLEFSQAVLQVPESSSVARLVVRRRGASDEGAAFTWRTVPGTATGDLDYASFGTVSEKIAPGQTEVAVLVPIVRDSIREGIETFDVEILETSGQARLGSVTRATVVIDDGNDNTINRQ